MYLGLYFAFDRLLKLRDLSGRVQEAHTPASSVQSNLWFRGLTRDQQELSFQSLCLLGDLPTHIAVRLRLPFQRGKNNELCAIWIAA